MTSPDTDRSSAHSILPLSVLEAIRSLDSPSDEEVAEYVDELLKKRLGLSDTVAAQIARYEAAVRRDDNVSAEELEQVLRLVSRRTDAALVFTDGGRRAARRGLARLSLMSRWSSRRLPGPMRRAVGFRAARHVAADVFDVTLVRSGKNAAATLHHAIPVRATPDGASCDFYAAGIGELLRQLVEFEGSMTHDSCRARGGDKCEWHSSHALDRRV